MKTYATLFILAAGLSLLLTPLVRRYALLRGVVDQPDKARKIHRRPVPRLGGLAIYGSLVLALTSLLLPENLVAAQFKAQLPHVLKMLIPSTLILLLGIYDDLWGTNAPIKFSVQIAAALFLYLLGFQVTRLWNPFGGTLELGLFSLPLTILWLVGITNAFNLIDGLDGLSAGAALFATLALLAAALFYGQPFVVILSITLAGSIVGFLRYNFSPATIFLGDSGSLFLGFFLAALSIEGCQKSTTTVAVAIPLVSFGLPIVDTFWALVRRTVSKKPLFTGDLEHIHHMILKRGLSIRQAIILLYGVCAVFALFSLLFLNPQGKIIGLVLFVIGISVFLGIQHLGYPEFQEMTYSVRKILRHHRVLAKNVHLRRAAAELNEAQSIEEVILALGDLVSADEFDRLEVRLTPTGQWAYPQARRFGFYSENGFLVWTWSRSKPQASKPTAVDSSQTTIMSDGDQHLWSLHVPLVCSRGRLIGDVIFYRDFNRGPLQMDVHHLCTLFQRELSRALERLETASSSEQPPVHQLEGN